MKKLLLLNIDDKKKTEEQEVTQSENLEEKIKELVLKNSELRDKITEIEKQKNSQIKLLEDKLGHLEAELNFKLRQNGREFQQMKFENSKLQTTNEEVILSKISIIQRCDEELHRNKLLIKMLFKYVWLNLHKINT